MSEAVSPPDGTKRRCIISDGFWYSFTERNIETGYDEGLVSSLFKRTTDGKYITDKLSHPLWPISLKWFQYRAKEEVVESFPDLWFQRTLGRGRDRELIGDPLLLPGAPLYPFRTLQQYPDLFRGPPDTDVDGWADRVREAGGRFL